MGLLKGIAGFAAIASVTWLLLDASNSSNVDELRRIVAEGNYCNEQSQPGCRVGGYLVLTPQAPSFVELVESMQFERYVPSDACQNGRIQRAVVDGDSWGYCVLRRLPLSYSEYEKRAMFADSAEAANREYRRERLAR